MHSRSFAFFALAMHLSVGQAMAQTELTVQYAYPSHQGFHQAVADAFMATNPDVKISFRAASPDYDEALQTVLRQSITRDLPDVFISGLQKLPDLVARGIAVPMTPFIQQEDLNALGYSDRILSLARVQDIQYGLAYATSTPIMFYNLALVKKAGGDPENLPKNWNGVITLAKAISALGGGVDGMYYDIGTDDWMFQNLIFNHGGELMSADGKDVAFDDERGKNAIRLFKRFFSEGGQKPIEQRAARQQFTAGTLGIYFTSPSIISTFEKQIGDRFEMLTAAMPLAEPLKANVPTGGMAGVITTTDTGKQKAAWQYLRFATGPAGQTIVAEATGYMPANTKALDPEFLGAFFEQHPNWKTSATQIPIARKWAPWPGSNGVKIARNLVDGLTRIAGGADADGTLVEMARETRALLAK